MILCGIKSAIAQLQAHAFKKQVVIAQLGKASSETIFHTSRSRVEKREGSFRAHTIGFTQKAELTQA
jgi:hypothetical protein